MDALTTAGLVLLALSLAGTAAAVAGLSASIRSRKDSPR